MSKIKTTLDWQVTDTDGADIHHTDLTKQGLQEALELLAEWTEEYEQSELYHSFDVNNEEELEERNDLAPRIELYEQDLDEDLNQVDFRYYCPNTEALPRIAQRIWNNR